MEHHHSQQEERWPFQLDETGESREFRVVKQDRQGNVVGEFIFHNDIHGDVELEVRRFDEAAFGAVRLVVR